jgi:hypothetical protein
MMKQKKIKEAGQVARMKRRRIIKRILYWWGSQKVATKKTKT